MRALRLLVLLLVLAAPAWGQQARVPGQLEIHHIDVGQADATLIVGPTGRTLLVDMGETGWNSHKNADRVAKYLEAVLGERRVDYFLVTHIHSDHIGYASEPPKGGIRYLMENHEFEFGTFLDRGFLPLGTTSGTYEHYRKWVEGFPNRQVVTLDTKIDLGEGVDVKVVAVNANGLLDGDRSRDRVPPSENDFSVSLKISFGRFDYFIGGDLSGETVLSRFGYEYHDIETAIAPLVGDVEVYKANHHGSGHSSNQFFIDVLSPEISVISCGKNNRFHHPDPVVLARLQAVGDVYQTQDDGSILVATSDGETYSVTTENSVDRRDYTAADPKALAGPLPVVKPFPRRGRGSGKPVGEPVGSSSEAPGPPEVVAGVPPEAPGSSPAYVLVQWGDLVSGGVSDLEKADGRVLAVRARAGDGSTEHPAGVAVAEWLPAVPLPAGTPSVDVKLTVSGPAGATLSLGFYDFQARTWTEIGTVRLAGGRQDVGLSARVRPGQVDPQGTVMGRIRASAPDPFVLEVDSLKLSPAGGP